MEESRRTMPEARSQVLRLKVRLLRKALAEKLKIRMTKRTTPKSKPKSMRYVHGEVLIDTRIKTNVRLEITGGEFKDEVYVAEDEDESAKNIKITGGTFAKM